MKDSGIKWIGEIPNGWAITKLGSHFKCRNVKVDDKSYPPLSVTKFGILPQMETVAKSDANDNRKQVLVGDFVINSRSDRKQSCGVSELNGSVSLINTVLFQPNPSFDLNYVSYLLKNYGFAEEFYRWGHGIVSDLWTTRWQEMKDIDLPFPPLNQQKMIAAFLKEKVKIINSLISNETKQIEKLEEYKKAIITKTITKGLDPNTKMKDSGVQWIGEIPEDCNISKIKAFYDVVLGKMLQPNRLTEKDVLLPYLCAASIDDGIIKRIDLKEMWFSADEVSKFNLEQGDLLVVEGGDVGDSAIVSFSVNDVGFQNSLHRVRSLGGNLVFLRYYLYFLKSIGYFDFLCNKATLAHLTKTKLENLPFILHSKGSQRKIAEYLDLKCLKIQNAISLKEAKIKKLQDYKKSLIYEYVTGKKAVEA